MSRVPIAIALALAAVACGKAKDEPAPAPSAPTPAPGGDAPAKAGGEIKVAGASDLVYAMEELGPLFEQETGTRVVFIPGSSGKLAAQIQQGAPFDVFLSANIAFVEASIAAGSCFADTKAPYAFGRVVMWTREGGPPLPPAIDGLADPAFQKIAIAQPDHAPYGAAAKAALQKVGAWAKVEGRLVYGSNIKDTMQLAETGNADVALIALALAKKAKGTFVEIPAELYPPIEQGMAACKASNEAGARRFVEFMRSPAVRTLLEGYGFGLPPA
jgi:molybdate transport system substrate-binding protein